MDKQPQRIQLFTRFKMVVVGKKIGLSPCSRIPKNSKRRSILMAAYIMSYKKVTNE